MNWKMIGQLKENKLLEAFLCENMSAIPHIQLEIHLTSHITY